MPEPHPFRRAVEARDFDRVSETLREDVVFHSPVLFRPFEGREMVMQVLTNAEAIFSDFSYTSEATGDGAVALRFSAKVGDREVEGIDFLELDDDGSIGTITVFMRPMSALQKFSEAMAERLGLTAG